MSKSGITKNDLEQLASHLDGFFRNKKKITPLDIHKELDFFWYVYIEGNGMNKTHVYKYVLPEHSCL